MKHQVPFASFSGARLAQGPTLFFPSLTDRGRQELCAQKADKEEGIHRVTLVGVDSGGRDHLSGGRIGVTLHVELDLGHFRRLRRSLRHANLRGEKVTFEFVLGKEGELDSLSVNGRPLGPDASCA